MIVVVLKETVGEEIRVVNDLSLNSTFFSVSLRSVWTEKVSKVRFEKA